MSEGVANGKAYIYKLPVLQYDYKKVTKEEVKNEQERVSKAIQTSLEELEKLKISTQENMGEEFAHIFRSHQTIAEDESIYVNIYQKI